MDFLLGDDIAPLAQLLGPLLEPDPLGSAGRQLLSHRLHPLRGKWFFTKRIENNILIFFHGNVPLPPLTRRRKEDNR